MREAADAEIPVALDAAGVDVDLAADTGDTAVAIEMGVAICAGARAAADRVEIEAEDEDDAADGEAEEMGNVGDTTATDSTWCWLRPCTSRQRGDQRLPARASTSW